MVVGGEVWQGEWEDLEDDEKQRQTLTVHWAKKGQAAAAFAV